MSEKAKAVQDWVSRAGLHPALTASYSPHHTLPRPAPRCPHYYRSVSFGSQVSRLPLTIRSAQHPIGARSHIRQVGSHLRGDRCWPPISGISSSHSPKRPCNRRQSPAICFIRRLSPLYQSHLVNTGCVSNPTRTGQHKQKEKAVLGPPRRVFRP